MSELFEVFQPGLAHWRRQRELDKVLVVRTDQGAPGKLPLDLESGTVTIQVPGAAGVQDEGEPGASDPRR